MDICALIVEELTHRLLSPKLGEPNAHNGQQARLLGLHIPSDRSIHTLTPDESH
jgi:hypothetical protein